MSRLTKLAFAATAATYLLIVVGGLVRATDSGLGCPDWPLCFGDWVPPAELHAWIEHSHRLVAAVLVGPLVALLSITVLLRHRADRPMLAAAVAAGVLVIIQAALGGAVVLARLRAELVTAHLAMALTVVGLLAVIAERAANGPMPPRTARRAPWLLSWLAALAVLGQMLLGSWVSGQGAGLAFGDFPLMDGQLLPALTLPAEQVHFAHRAAAVLVAGLVVAAAVGVARSTGDAYPRRLAYAAASLVAIQVALGAANVWSRLSAVFVVPHLAAGAALWIVCVALAVAARRLEPAPAPAAEDRTTTVSQGGRRIGDTLRAYVALTKPRIIELLLITTVPAMVLAARGLPSPWLVAATLVGGALAAGGANALNCYLDRDIDDVMRRTRGRPLPRHRISPAAALRFGLALSALSFAWLAFTVNLLSAVLAVGAIGFYVGVYTMWLKRSTPQNIVIGGAAGCVPVLVGWAAVTGDIGWPALVLFAIVFAWTPPHFWALALRYRGDYAAARVPMLPVVRGERETARQILWYTVALVAVTLVLLPVGGMGVIYLAAALVLGALFVAFAVRLVRRVESGREAIRLFRFSTSYLTLLFSAIAVDSLLFVPIA